MKQSQIDIFTALCADFEQRNGFKIVTDPGSQGAIEGLVPQFGALKLRAMWNYYITDEKEIGFGISIKRFLEPRVLMKLAARAHLKPKGDRGSRVKGSPYYKCAGCGREIVALLSIDDPMEEYPAIWVHRCPGSSANSQFWSRNQWDAWYESGCGGEFRQVFPSPVEKRADPVAVGAVVSEIQNALDFNPDEEIDL